MARWGCHQEVNGVQNDGASVWCCVIASYALRKTADDN